MSLTIRDIAVDMDSHVRYGVAGKSDEQTAYQVATINRALEEIRVLCPQELRDTVPVVWTPGAPVSTTISGSSVGPIAALANYAAGCSVNIDGDASFNSLATAGDGSTAATLLFPYSGTTGTHTVTLYGDCVKLGTTVDHVLGGELLHERRPLDILNTRADWLAYQRLWGLGYSNYDYGINQVLPNVVRQPGVPRGIWLETCLNGNAIEYRVHCAPMPNDTYRATLDVATMAADITADDIVDGGPAGGVVVSGTITPNFAGRLRPLGNDSLGHMAYAGGTVPAFLGFNAGTWNLQDLALGALFQLAGDGSDPTGTYASANGLATGTPMVSSATTTTRPVPGQRVYGILRALCMWHWMGSPWFRPTPAVQKVIEQEYVNATQQTQAIRPAVSQSVRSVVYY